MKLTSMLMTAALALPFAAGCKSSSAHEAMHAQIAAEAQANASAASNPAVGDDATVPRLAVGTKTKCPVSGEDFTVKADTLQVSYAGKRYAFCCPDCQPTFAKNPAKYAAK
jgi:YHS domain-containing protein